MELKVISFPLLSDFFFFFFSRPCPAVVAAYGNYQARDQTLSTSENAILNTAEALLCEF